MNVIFASRRYTVPPRFPDAGWIPLDFLVQGMEEGDK